MADGKNQNRAMRILEIMNDFRTLQVHIQSHTTRAGSSAPDTESANLAAYVLLRQCQTEAQALLRTDYNPGNLGMPGQIAQTEVQKATLQRIVLDAATRRFLAHKIYLRASAATRWIQSRQQLLRGERPNSRHTEHLRRFDQRLREDLSGITDSQVYSDLRAADRRKEYWISEDPSLERMLAWSRAQR